MKCDQCDSMYIQGVFCHETGCYNTNKVYNEEEKIWEDKEIDECDDDSFVTIYKTDIIS